MVKGLFTSTEEIKFQDVYVNGHVVPRRDPNVIHGQRHLNKKCFCHKKSNKGLRVLSGRTR